jgi:hypothetical protein
MGTSGILVLAPWSVVLGLQFLGPKTPVHLLNLVYAALFLVGLLAAVANYRFVYWELGPGGLLVRRFWQQTQIEWSEVTGVGWRGNFSGTFRVNIGHRIENYARLYIEPFDRAGLTAALRKFAPHATFELQ